MLRYLIIRDAIHPIFVSYLVTPKPPRYDPIQDFPVISRRIIAPTIRPVSYGGILLICSLSHRDRQKIDVSILVMANITVANVSGIEEGILADDRGRQAWAWQRIHF